MKKIIIKVKVKPNSKEERIERKSGDEFVIYLKEPPEGNKANTRLINLLAREFGVSYKDIKIKNRRAREKIIEIN